MYFALSLLLVVFAFSSQFRVSWSDSPALPAGTPGEIETLAAERDLNIVLVLIDTLRADHLSSYGYARPTSPEIDRLAGRGIRFARVEAQSSWTKASMASLWTSLVPERTGVSRLQHALPESTRMPAERLRATGYLTVGIWRNDWVAPQFGFGQGFDFYFNPVPRSEEVAAHRAALSTAGLRGTDLDATRSALEFLSGVGDRPFFLYVHYMDVHQYVHADTSPDFGPALPDLYDAAIHWTDRNVGMLVDVLARQKLLDDTIIVIASDHGEAFGEHGSEGHARTLYTETQHTPLIIALPYAIPSGLVVEEVVANVDLWPTLFEWLGIEATNALDGESLVPLIRAAEGNQSGDAVALRDRTFVSQIDQTWGRVEHAPRPVAAAATQAHRLVWHRSDPERLELFHLASDPGERVNLATEDPERARAMRDELGDLLNLPSPFEGAVDVEVDASQSARLRALGYSLPLRAGGGAVHEGALPRDDVAP